MTQPPSIPPRVKLGGSSPLPPDGSAMRDASLASSAEANHRVARPPRAWLTALIPILASVLALTLVVGGLSLLGYPAWGLVRRWVHGAVGNHLQIAASLASACPLLLTGLAVGVAFKSGVLNIGAQGQYLLGAVASVAMATRFAPPMPPQAIVLLSVVAGIIAGSLWAGVAWALERYRGVPIVLSTILLNFVAAYLATALLHGVLQARGTSAPQSAEIGQALWLPVLIKYTNLHVGVPIAFGLAVVAWLVLRRTTFGFEILVTGSNPQAAALAGMPIGRRRAQVMLISGALAGLAGAFQVLGVAHFMTSSFGNYGYAGIAVALLGWLDPLGIAAAALFFGALDTGAQIVEESSLGLPHNMADVVKAVIILVMLLLAGWAAQRRLKQRQGD
ncbi:MAG: ABC transporter permease [Phycisphaerales bacterium]|nr:ABC transporter permease [Phycisphaerales bacterium]